MAVGPQLRFNTRSESLGPTAKAKSNQILLDIPVLINYRFDINRNFNITPFVGPMLSYALSGNTKIGSNKINWYGDNSDLSRFNLYAALGVSFAFDSFKLFGSYRYGLLDIDKDAVARTHTSGFSLGVGFSF